MSFRVEGGQRGPIGLVFALTTTSALALVPCLAPARPLLDARFPLAYEAATVRACAIGDVDADGHLDYVAAVEPGSIVVRRGDAEGAFELATELATAGLPLAVAIAPVNADAAPDLVVVSTAAVSLFLGNGDGTFGARIDVAGSPPSQPAVHVHDVDLDGRADLVVTGPQAGGVTVYRQIFAGFFFGQTTTLPGIQALHSDLADFDGDGAVDLAVVSPNLNGVAMALGRGDGTFEAPVTHSTPSDPRALAAGDATGDGRADVVAVCGANLVAVLAGDGNGAFAPASVHTTGNTPSHVELGDVNGDAIVDVVTANARDFSLLAGTGSGAFATPVSSPSEGVAVGLTLGDIDADGRLDVVTAHSTRAVSAHLQRADGSFGFVLDLATTGSATYLEVEDLDGNGSEDLAVPNADGVSVSLFLNAGDGKTWTRTDLATAPGNELLEVGDWNDDGRADLVTGGDDLKVHVRFRQPDGTYIAAPPLPLTSEAVTGWARDLDNDGVDDLLIGTLESLEIFAGVSLQHRQSIPLIGYVRSLDTADLNGDSVLDAVVATNDVGQPTRLLLGNGQGGFAAPIDIGGMGEWHGFELADLNGDDNVDLFQVAPGWIEVRDGLGGGAFAAPRAMFGPEYIVRATLGDFTGDGLDDVLTANYDRPGTVSVLRNRGDGTFEPIEGFGVADWPSWAETGDFDGDGQRDAAVLSYDAEAITVLLSRDPVPTDVGPAGPRVPQLAMSFDRAGGPIRIQYRVGAAWQPARLEIHDVRGRLVRAHQDPGSAAVERSYVWDRTDAHGLQPARGVYFVTVRTGGVSASSKLVLLHR